MGSVALHGFGSGAPLNFKIVGGTTEPTNPKENMIWVNTDQKITGWNFSATDPFNFKIASNAGAVVGTAGGITFTKKNAGKAIFAFARNETFTIPLLISDSQDAAVLARSDGEEHEAFAFTYKDKIWYNTYPGLGMDLWDTATPNIENTTDIVAIKEYLVDMLEKAEGMVWIATEASSPVEFNALKKNGLQVYPLKASQYISGAWTEVAAKIYQSGSWKDLITDFVLYDRGTKNVTFTTNGNGSLSEASDHLTFKATADEYSTFDAVVDRTFDLTLYKTMTFDYQTINNNSVFAAIVMDGDTVVARANASSTATTFGTATVDISELKGEHKLKIRHYSEGAARTVYLYSWKLLAT